MLEQEIKLHVPPAARKAVAAKLAAQPGARRLRLKAMYFDTADRQLARRLAAIRLRQEGRKWVQTFKMAGDDAVSRIELNHPRPGPELDLSVYAGTPAQAVIDSLSSPLELRYETDVLRLARQVRTRWGVAEIAHDTGAIRSGGLELTVDELEFEHVSGRLTGLFSLAGRWLREHGLVMDLRSKAERGDALASAARRIAAAPLAEQASLRAAQIERFHGPVGAARIRLGSGASPRTALVEVTAGCFEQIARNAALLAGVDGARLGGGAEHVHQLRVGMRRLRSAWKLFHGWTALPPEDAQAAAREHFGAFGRARDADVLGATVAPALERAGMPPLALPHTEGVDAAKLARSPDFQGWLLDLLAWNVTCGMGEEPATGTPARSLHRLVARRLRKWHRRIIADGLRFHELPDEQRHSLRKLAKRLRYGLAFTEALFPSQRTRPYKKRLAALQDVLGEVNDLVVARDRYAAMTRTDPQAWFAVGWTTARLEFLYVDAEDAIAELDAAKPFWK